MLFFFSISKENKALSMITCSYHTFYCNISDQKTININFRNYIDNISKCNDGDDDEFHCDNSNDNIYFICYKRNFLIYGSIIEVTN